MRMSNLPIFASPEGACVCTEIEPCARRRRIDRPASIANGKRTPGAGAIYWFADNSGGMCFNWQTGRKALFYYDYQGKRPSRAELRKMQTEMRKQRELYEAETRARQYAVSILAAQIWDGADSLMVGHKYLVRKRLPQSRNGLRCIALDKHVENGRDGSRSGTGHEKARFVLCRRPCAGTVHGRPRQLERNRRSLTHPRPHSSRLDKTS